MPWTVHSTVPFALLDAPGTIPLLAESGVGPEIYFPCEILGNFPRGRAEAAAEALEAAGIRSATVHGPFEDLWAGSRDEEGRRLASLRFRQAIAAASLFRARGIVLHGGWHEWVYDFQPDRWFAPALRTFREAAEEAERTGVSLFIENVFDEVPDHLLRLREAIGSERVGFCFDPGHATLFSRLPLAKWAEAFGARMGEMHVHDNRGQRDDHLPVGEGTINFRGVILAAADAGARPILTIEPHRREHFPRFVGGLRRILSDI